MTKDEAYPLVMQIINEWTIEKDQIATEARSNGTWVYGVLGGNDYLFKECEAKHRRRIEELVAQIDE